MLESAPTPEFDPLPPSDPLPACRFRGRELSRGLWECGCDRLVLRDGVVPADFCRHQCCFVAASADQAPPRSAVTWANTGSINDESRSEWARPIHLIGKRYIIGRNYHRSGWPYAFDALRTLHRKGGLLFDDFVEQTWFYNGRRQPITRPWAGIFHHTPHAPPWCHGWHNLDRLIEIPEFAESLRTLQLALTLSEYAASWIRESWGVPAVAVKHPSAVPERLWDPARRARRLVQAGWYLRDTRFIHQVDTDWQRVRLIQRGSKHIIAHDERCARRAGTQHAGVIERGYVPHAEYDELLATSVVGMHVYDASANNVTIECIARSTPLLVNRHPAVVEYLGPDYPLYHDGPAAAAGRLTDGRVLAAHEHLKRLDKSWLDAQVFARDVRRAIHDVFQDASQDAVHNAVREPG